MPEPSKDKPITVNPTRSDPYKNFKFHLTFEGRVVAGASSVSGLPLASHDTPIKSPGYHKFEDITLERGVIHDSGFENWLSGASKPGIAKPNLVLKLHDETGRALSSWTLYNCRVSKMEAKPASDAKANGLTVARLVIHTESLKLNP